jgi:intein/homing endonuclease
MLNLQQLFRRHAGRRVESAKYVRIVQTKKGWDSMGRGYIACASYSTKIWDPWKKRYIKNTTGPGKKPARYVTVFVFLDTRLHVIVSCSCPDFKYRWEVALNHKEAAEIEYSNGELPVIRNPSMRPTFCVARGSLVETRRGQIPIELVRIGDEVLTLNGYRKVEAASLTRKGAEVVRLLAKSGRTLTVTPDHKVLCLKPNSVYPDWVEAQDVSIGDNLVSLLPASAVPVQAIDPLFGLLGLVIAESDEGHFAPFGQAEQDDYANFYRAVFNREPHVASCSRLELTREEMTEYESFGLRFGDSRKHKIPAWMFGGSQAQRISLLYGIFQGNGWISEDGSAATLGTSSRRLAVDYQRLLFGLGIHSRITINLIRGRVKMFLVRPTSRGVQKLISILPHLRKYGSRRHVGERKSKVEDRFAVAPAALISEVKALYVESVRDRVPNTVVAARTFFASMGWAFNDGFATKIKSLASAQTVVEPHAQKPLVGASAHELVDWYFHQLSAKGWAQILAVPRKWDSVLRTKTGVISWLNEIAEHEGMRDKLFEIFRLLLSDIVFEPVVSAKTIDDKDVYDLTIAGTPHFTANGFIVHNCKHCIALYQKILPDLPKPKHEKSNPIGKPEVQIPPSVQKKRQKEAEDAARKARIKPIKITTPQAQRSVKPGRKQSTVPRAQPAPAPKKSAPAVMKPTRVQPTPAAKPASAPKPAPAKSQPARMTTKPARVSPTPTSVPMMRAKK